MPTVCRDCQRPIVFAITVNGRRMPLDPQPDPAGNCVLVGGEVEVLTGDDLLQARADGTTRMPHKATCPAVVARRARDRTVNTATGRTVVQESLL